MEKSSCAQCGEAVPASELVISEVGEICPSCELDQGGSFGAESSATSFLIMGALFGVAPFFASYTTGAGLSSFGVGLHLNLTTEGADHVAFFGGLFALAAGSWVLR